MTYNVFSGKLNPTHTLTHSLLLLLLSIIFSSCFLLSFFFFLLFFARLISVVAD